MTPETTKTGQKTPKGFEDMAKMMEQCGCCGMMENMMSFMQAKRGTADDGEEEAKTAGDSKPENEAGGKTGR